MVKQETLTYIGKVWQIQGGTIFQVKDTYLCT
jgi:hypothetical protein